MTPAQRRLLGLPDLVDHPDTATRARRPHGAEAGSKTPGRRGASRTPGTGKSGKNTPLRPWMRAGLRARAIAGAASANASAASAPGSGGGVSSGGRHSSLGGIGSPAGLARDGEPDTGPFRCALDGQPPRVACPPRKLSRAVLRVLTCALTCAKHGAVVRCAYSQRCGRNVVWHAAPGPGQRRGWVPQRLVAAASAAAGLAGPITRGHPGQAPADRVPAVSVEIRHPLSAVVRGYRWVNDVARGAVFLRSEQSARAEVEGDEYNTNSPGRSQALATMSGAG